MKKLSFAVTAFVFSVWITFMLVSQVSAAESFTFNLNAGYTFISPPLDVRTTAKQVCRLNSAVTEVSQYKKSAPDTIKFVPYRCGQPNRKNFTLLPNVGYMIKSIAYTTITINGEPLPGDWPYELTDGYNSIGIAIADKTAIKADNLCGPFTGNVYEVIEVLRWYASGWDSHLCSVPSMNNFGIVKGEGYLVKAIKLN